MNLQGWSASVLRAHATMVLIALAAVLPFLAVAFAAPTQDSVAASISQLRSRDARERSAAADALVKAGPQAIPALLAAVDSRIGLAVNAILVRMGPPAVAKLMEAIKQPELRAQAGDALYQVITPASSKHLQALIKCTADPELTHACGRAMVKILGAGARSRAPAIAALLKSQDKDVRVYACLALGQIGPRARASVQDLAAALKDAEADVRRAAARALGAMGTAAKSAAPALEAAGSDPDGDVRRLSAEALRKVSA